MVKRPMVRQSSDPFNSEVLFYEMLLKSYYAHEQFIIAPPLLFWAGTDSSYENKYSREFYDSLIDQMGLTNPGSVQDYNPSTRYLFNVPDMKGARRLWNKLFENVLSPLVRRNPNLGRSQDDKINEALEQLNNKGHITVQVANLPIFWPTISYNPGCDDESNYALFYHAGGRLDVAKMDEYHSHIFRKEIYEPIRDDSSKSQPVPYVRR